MFRFVIGKLPVWKGWVTEAVSVSVPVAVGKVRNELCVDQLLAEFGGHRAEEHLE